MKYIYDHLVFLAVILIANASPSTGAEEHQVDCKFISRESRWRDDCNWCRCTETGLSFCTRRGCSPALSIRLQNEKQCEGNPEWKKDCNWCRCVEGREQCTERLCGGASQKPVKVLAVEPASTGTEQHHVDCKFTPNEESRWRDNCNWCHCTESGISLCTRKGCPPASSLRLPNKKQCEGNPEWKKDCNWCRCVEGREQCTKRLCGGASQKPVKVLAVKPASTGTGECTFTSKGSRWRHNCNWCRCTETGRSLCTRRGCPPALRIRLENEKQCEGNPEWKKDCNWCRCVEGREQCTERLCEGGLQTPVKKLAVEIVPTGAGGGQAVVDCKFTSKESRWRDACNWCHCTERGTSICTKRGCPPALSIRLQNEKQCEGNPEWKKDCNWCRCVEGREQCTERLCAKKPLSKTPMKEPLCEVLSEEGSWKDDCNWCKCSDGLPYCTLRMCITQPKSEGEMECHGRIRWKKDCNWCECIKGVAVCSGKTCGKDPSQNVEREEICKTGPQGGRWRIECNWCNCRNGMGLCTKKGCKPGLNNKLLRGTPVCEGDITWREDCNWCRCVNGEGYCTERHCGEEATDSETCTEGQTWIHNCNTCFCKDGQGFCTLKACINDKQNAIDAEILRNHAAELTDLASFGALGSKECEDGSVWKEGCNTCSCNSGRVSCTLMRCFPSSKSRMAQPQPSCKEGSQWRDDCNVCICGNGIPLCTEKACFSKTLETPTAEIPAIRTAQLHGAQTPALEIKEHEPMCSEGSRWRDLCNWCTCSNGIGMCEQKGCLSDAHELDGTCEGDSRWKKDCNWCNCVHGRGICTAKACLAAADKKQKQEQEQEPEESTCTEGSRWGVNCNWCTCVKGVGICTLRGCLPGSETLLDGVCEGQSRWKIDCNWCRCVNGTGLCTEKACIPAKIATSPHEVRSCTSGNSWTEDCNTCICANQLQVCTKRACLPKQGRSSICNEGEIWKDVCNTCRCINGFAACTRMLCIEIPHLCTLPPIKPDTELCAGFETKWTYNGEKNTCEQIVYGGCGATENLFASEQECNTICTNQKLKARTVDFAEDSKGKCYLPVDVGPCFASMIRYAFNPKEKRCEIFHFGGCQGNQNNFLTAQECHTACGGSLPSEEPKCDRSKCNWKRFAHYLAKECQPVYEGGSCCPTKFVCKSERERGKSANKCYYKGKEYQIRDNVPVEDECSRGCRCVLGQVAEINCANVECPSSFRRPEPGCRYLYAEGKCCAKDMECIKPGTPPQLEQRSDQKCVWKGKTFKLGDRMYFEDDDEPCQQCVCTPDFTDLKGPGCKKINCGLDFRYRKRFHLGCTPIFFEEKCCPIDWICPDDDLLTGTVEPPQHKTAVMQSEGCSLGSLFVPLEGLADVSDCHIKCSCQTPPELTCVRYRSCEMAQQSLVPKDVEDLGCPKVDCPVHCNVTADSFTGCPKCFCNNLNVMCSEPSCPPACRNPSTEFDESMGCYVCKCECRTDFSGRPPCPMDCSIKIFYDEETGCQKCVCDSTNPGNPFSNYKS